jgi:predicted RNA-binding Zn ribbon-like protein
VTRAPVLVLLANTGRPRRPPGARRAVAEDPFADTGSATELVGRLLGRPVAVSELDGLRALAREAGRVAESLVQGVTPLPARLNRLAAGCVGRTELRVTRESGLEAVVVWDSAPAAAALARRVIEELAAVDPVRLRCCARPECSLFFYDSSRSGTQRWHSEVPCGWRERQRRRRARAETADGGRSR